MSHNLFKLLATAAVLLILMGRFYLRLRRLDGDARDRALKTGLSGELLAIAGVAALFVYLLLASR